MNTTATTLSPPVLAARDIRESYGKGTARFDALAGVSLSVYAGGVDRDCGEERVGQVDPDAPACVVGPTG